jgi:hypothetical protein
VFTKEHILAEIQRTAEDGKALGKGRFARETGIAEWDWRGRYWARWSDAVREAGLEPNRLQGRSDDDAAIRHLTLETRRLGHLPTYSELALRRREDPSLPGEGVFQRLGSKAALASMVAEYCGEDTDFADVLEIVRPLLDSEDSPGAEGEPAEPSELGYVYMLKSGRHYKLGRTNSLGRREYELAIQLPERADPVHAIKTDDPAGIESYWHRRFAERRRNGEWFELTQGDVRAFKRRKFM